MRNIAVLCMLVATLVSSTSAIAGAGTGVTVAPARVGLASGLAEQRLRVNRPLPDGHLADITSSVRFTSQHPAIARVNAEGLVTPQSDGQTVIMVKAGRETVRVPVIVTNAGVKTISFLNHIEPVLSKAGCNAGACHGAQYGKGGFKLSLFGYDPELDYEAITQFAEGRRIVRSQPDESLLLKKPALKVSHGGGMRFAPESTEYSLLRNWIAAGAPGPLLSDKSIVRVSVSPVERVVAAPRPKNPRGQEQLLVTAYYSDGTSADVTRLARFNSNDPEVADLAAEAPNGRVEFKASGETAIMVRYQSKVAVCRVIVPYATRLAQYPKIAGNNYVDNLVVAKLKKMGVVPSDVCDDATFIRRVSLDLTGSLPTREEVEAFLQDQGPKKRERLIDSLLQRPEFVDFWTMKWSDLLRVNRNFTQPKGMWAFRNWIWQSVQANKPWDQFVREILTSEGNTYEEGPANYYRIADKPEERAENVVQMFLGIRVQCARCHNHPFERWSQNDYHSVAAFFARVAVKPGEEGNDRIVFAKGSGEHSNPRSKKVMVPKALAGDFFDGLTPDDDRRDNLAAWLTSPKNTMFSQSIVNRLWKHFMGRGIVDPADDMRETNPPVNKELLEKLAADLVDHKFDLKHVMRTICASRIYQSSSVPNATNLSDEKLFSRYYLKRLSAEQLLDAIGHATGTTEKFAGLPNGTRAIQLPDSNVASYFLDVFGRPAREITCECERSDEANMAQALHLINSPSIQSKISSPEGRVERLLKSGKTDREIVEDLYAATLCRKPEAVELEDAISQLQSSASRKEGAEDLLWALLNSREFIFTH